MLSRIYDIISAIFGSDGPLEVSLVLVGDVSDQQFTVVRDALESHYDVTVTLDSRKEPDERFITPQDSDSDESIRQQAYDRDREQYAADELVFLKFPDRALPLMWLTTADIYHSEEEEKVFVFGIAAVGGRISAVSTARLADEDMGSPTATDRLRKQAIKQFGRSLGAEKCSGSNDTQECVMTQTFLPSDLDRLDEYICPDCATDIGKRHLDRESDDR